jgi:hypothetical protein
MFQPFEWVPIKRGDLLPLGAVCSGKTDSDGDVYVARNDNGECGKLNLDNGHAWNIWCHHDGQAEQGEVLVIKQGLEAEWRRVHKGDDLPEGAVFGGRHNRDGDTYVARNASQVCGKLNLDNGKVNNIWVHGYHRAADEGDVLVVSCYEWAPFRRGDALPEGAIQGGQTEADGDIYVARNLGGEPGKLNLDNGKAWNLWCHHDGETQEGQVLVAKKGAPFEWKRVQKGDPLPEGAVLAGKTGKDGEVYVGRFNQQCGKVNLDGDRIHNFWVHSAGFFSVSHSEEGEILVILPGQVPTSRHHAD